MPGIPLLFTDSGSTPDLVYTPLPGLYLGDDTYLGDGIFLDEGTSEAFGPLPALVEEGVVISVTAGMATAIQTTVTLPAGDVVETVVAGLAVAFAPLPFLGGQDVIETVTTTPAVAFMPVPQTSGGLSIILIPSVRELPPLRLHHVIETPSGRFFRWAEDEPNPANVPSGVRFSDTMPGGFETWDATLPRKVGQDAPDLDPLSTVHSYGAGGEKAWEGRLERSPRVSGDQTAVSPSAAGYQAHLDDNQSVRELLVDRELARWVGPSRQRESNMRTVGHRLDGWSVGPQQDETTGIPAIAQTTDSIDQTGSNGLQLAESWYSANGLDIGLVMYEFSSVGLGNGVEPAWTNTAVLSSDDVATVVQVGTDHNGANGPVGGLLVAAAGGNKFALLQSYYNGVYTGGPPPSGWAAWWRTVAVYGQQGLPGVTPTGGGPPGFRASTIVDYVVRKWAPMLTTEVQPSGFVIPHAVFLEPTTTSEVVKQVTRFGLQDWAVWDDKTFWWHDRGARGRNWRTRVGPAQLEETGPQVDRIFESVIVQYQDVDGSTMTVGPPGSGCNWEEPDLKDTDPDNPANQAGITRRALLTMGTAARDPVTLKPGMSIQVGRRFLQEHKLLDSSGRARIVGHVENDRGVLFPYWAVRAGDTLSVIDASDSSPRRIVRTEKDHASRTCSVDLDSPPEGLQALLERLGVGIVDLGFN